MALNIQHGGDLDIIERHYNISKDKLINFSGNVNPLGFPKSIKDTIIENIDNISSYPDINYLALKKSIGEYTNIDSENIIPGNGATELIGTFIKVLNPKNTVIVSPAYSEYQREIIINNGNFSFFQLREEDNFICDIERLKNFVSKSKELIIICNPNNPTGTALNIFQIEDILKYCKERNIFVMIDETYVEFTDDNENISCVSLVNKYDNIFIIRGTSKFFASPGIRLGYAICKNKSLINKINEIKDPWSVNVLAELAGKVMFSDKDFIEKTKKFINMERAKIIDELSSWKNIKLYKTKSNFILIKLLNENLTSSKIFEYLIKYNIVIRDASDFPFLGNKYLRFCILSSENNNLLISKLKDIIE